MPKSNPFTPKSGWEPKIFAGRKDEIEFLDKKLEEARNGLKRGIQDPTGWVFCIGLCGCFATSPFGSDNML